MEKDFIYSIIMGELKANGSWNNGKKGAVRSAKKGIVYYFCNESEVHYALYETEEFYKLPVVACGFVGYFLKKGCYLTTDKDDKITVAIRSSVEIYNGFLQMRAKQYTDRRKVQPNNLKTDLELENEFYTSYNPRKEEQPFVEQSKALNEYIAPYEADLISDYVENYYLYVEKQQRERGIKQNSSKSQKQIQLSENVLNWLAETKCTNGKTYIENTTLKPLKWLQNKQLARELLTHQKININNLKGKELAKQISELFVDTDNKPLILAKNKKTTDQRNTKQLYKFLATL